MKIGTQKPGATAFIDNQTSPVKTPDKVEKPASPSPPEQPADTAKKETFVSTSVAVTRLGKAKLGPADAQFYVGAEAGGSGGVKKEGGLPYVTGGGSASVGIRGAVTAATELGKDGAAKVTGYVSGGAEAGANGSAGLNGVSAEAGAFVGAKAGVEGEVEKGPVEVGGKAEGMAGIGANAGFTAGIYDGKVTVGIGAGAALLVGAGGAVEVTVDTGEAADNATGASDASAEAAKKAADEAQKAAKKAAEAAANTANNAAEGAAETVSNVISAANPWD